MKSPKMRGSQKVLDEFATTATLQIKIKLLSL
jgi:hypothetical protein